MWSLLSPPHLKFIHFNTLRDSIQPLGESRKLVDLLFFPPWLTPDDWERDEDVLWWWWWWLCHVNNVNWPFFSFPLVCFFSLTRCLSRSAKSHTHSSSHRSVNASDRWMKKVRRQLTVPCLLVPSHSLVTTAYCCCCLLTCRHLLQFVTLHTYCASSSCLSLSPSLVILCYLFSFSLPEDEKGDRFRKRRLQGNRKLSNYKHHLIRQDKRYDQEKKKKNLSLSLVVDPLFSPLSSSPLPPLKSVTDWLGFRFISWSSRKNQREKEKERLSCPIICVWVWGVFHSFIPVETVDLIRQLVTGDGMVSLLSLLLSSFFSLLTWTHWKRGYGGGGKGDHPFFGACPGERREGSWCLVSGYKRTRRFLPTFLFSFFFWPLRSSQLLFDFVIFSFIFRHLIFSTCHQKFPILLFLFYYSRLDLIAHSP